MYCSSTSYQKLTELIRFVFLLLLLCLISTKSSAGEVLPLPSEVAQVSYNGHIAYWIDHSKLATLREAQSANYTPVKQQTLYPSKHPIWFKLSVQSQALESLNWIFFSHWTPIDWMDVWVVGESATSHFALGDHRPYQNRVIKSRLPAFPVSLAANERANIYIRADSMSLITLIGGLSPVNVFEAKNKSDDVLFGVFFGVLGMMALIAFLVGAWIKDQAMLGYSGYVATFMLTSFAMLGYASVFLSDWLVNISDIFVGVFSCLLLSSVAWMWIHLLPLKTQFKKIYWLFLITGITGLLGLTLVSSDYYAQLNSALRWLSYPLNIIPAVLLAYLWRRDRKTEYLIYLLSFVGLLLSSFIYISMTANLLPLSLNRATLYLEMLLLNIFIMSLGMAFRVRKIQLDKVASDNKADLALQRTQEERRFVAMLSHEFRNPLASIDRSAQMLILTNPDIATATTNRFHSIRASVSRLSSLVDNFLMSERLEQGQFALHVSPCCIADLVANISSQFTEEDWQRIELLTDKGEHRDKDRYKDRDKDKYSAKDEAAFEIDLNLVSMAVGNLIHNALRYGYPETHVQLSFRLANQTLSITVADAGPGISDEEMQMLGTPYYRAPNSFGKKGTGLGYYFCRRIVELHGGELSASRNALGGLSVNMALHQLNVG